MPMTMVRRPRSATRFAQDIRREIKETYIRLADRTIKQLSEEVSDWEHKPKFKKVVTTSKRKWRMTIKWDGRTKAGKIYNWVSLGTGSRGDKKRETYIIRPKKAKALRFNLPMEIKTMADFGKVAPSLLADSAEIVTRAVKAPGIYPRHLGKDVYAHLKTRKSGSFHNETEAAIKRAIRAR